MTQINETNAAEVATVTKKLGQFFDPAEVRWKPQSVKNGRALAMAYIDARCVMDRLDEAVGIDAWHDSYSVLGTGEVECRLAVRIAGEWITKADVGSPSEQPDSGDRMKAAYSDALKRAAVKWGIGRYLYRLPAQWVDYDQAKRAFVKTPTLPAWARGAGAAEPPASPPPPPAPASAKVNPDADLVNRLEQRFKGCSSKAIFDQINNEIVEHVRRGEISPQGAEYLRGPAKAAQSRLQQQQPAGR